MLAKLFSADVRPGAFFRRVDWNAFWTASCISMLVYFFTLAPSVTLEDSGELVTAGCHWGVPHPPGYPIWTICANLFSIAFEWVTFRGQPTPAWAVALMSAVFGAFAAGFTAMLITRSASDMLYDAHKDEADYNGAQNNLLAWAGGVGGSLVFAFSPVMWSQATISEVYTLNAFFLMWIFLLTYRWMRQPSAKILWLTAFVFGLGLTNYQVLLLAAVPLMVVIFLRDIGLFRDFVLVGIPVLLTAHVLQIGSLLPAMPGSSGPAYAKFQPLATLSVPSMSLLIIAAVILIGALILGLMSYSSRHAKNAFFTALEKGPLLAGLVAFAALLILFSTAITHPISVSPDDRPLAAPSVYTSVVGLILLVFACCIGGAVASRGEATNKKTYPWLVAAGVMLLILFFRLSALPGAPIPYGYSGQAFDWMLPGLLLFGGLVVTFIIGATIPNGLFFACSVAAVQIAVFVLLRKGMMNGLTHPTTWWFWWSIIWNFVLLLLAWLMLPHGRTVALTILFCELGTSFYLYMPLVSDLLNPPMDWGYPRTWEGFKHALTRGQYEKLDPADIFNKKFIFQLGSYFTDLRVQFTLIAATLGFIPFALWRIRWGTRIIRALYVASGCYVITAVLVVISEFYQGEPFLRLDKILISIILLLSAIGIAVIIFQQVEAFVVHTWKAKHLSESLTVGITLAGMGAVIVFFAAKGLLHILTPVNVMPSGGAQLGALLLALLIFAGLGVLWFISQRMLEKKVDFKTEISPLTQQWMLSIFVGFLMMSVLMVVLSNIKGDLQDAFIQKVKFISSHGLFTIWVGYGLVFGLEIANRLLKGLSKRSTAVKAIEHPIRLLLVCMGLLMSTIPIYENYTNEYLVFSSSGAEQNNHDFGWQFGNYQLRGAAAIIEELEADEEPLPNPLFPEEMEPRAIFFGGTDPGRFVPTYMIYSADVRPDVYLITQNALADNTYMSTMRDIMGNEVWIPTPDDSARAFQIYVDEVQAGKRPQNAALTIENGRVQVSGALGVMEINGILCDMIFAKNKARHAFYIEESYVIGWMFPYLTPHGLIMKINNQPTPLTPALVRTDMDFWDWYTRRLLCRPEFRRDLPAQKSFSKLRSAIAGLYAARGLRTEGERAFQEARSLYPVSPEANFRLIQEVLMAQGRFDEAIDILSEFNKKDPNNDRGPGFVNYISRIRDLQKRIQELAAKAQANKGMTPNEAFELAMAYRELGQPDAAALYLTQLIGMPNMPADRLIEIGTILGSLKKHEQAVKAIDLAQTRMPPNCPPEALMAMVKIYAEANQVDKMLGPLSNYLRLQPQDWNAWLEMASICAVRQQQAQLQYAIQKALEFGKQAAMQRMQEHPVLRQVAGPILQQLMQQQNSLGLPMGGPRR